MYRLCIARCDTGSIESIDAESGDFSRVRTRTYVITSIRIYLSDCQREAFISQRKKDRSCSNGAVAQENGSIISVFDLPQLRGKG